MKPPTCEYLELLYLSDVSRNWQTWLKLYLNDLNGYIRVMWPKRLSIAVQYNVPWYKRRHATLPIKLHCSKCGVIQGTVKEKWGGIDWNLKISRVDWNLNKFAMLRSLFEFNNIRYIPRERFLDPPCPPSPLLSILYMTIYFSANLFLFIFVI